MEDLGLQGPGQLENYYPPDVTFCNSNPMKYKYRESADDIRGRSRMEFDYLFGRHSRVGNLTEEMQSLFRTFLGYFQYLGIDNAIHISHERDIMLVECSIMYVESGMAVVLISYH